MTVDNTVAQVAITFSGVLLHQTIHSLSPSTWSLTYTALPSIHTLQQHQQQHIANLLFLFTDRTRLLFRTEHFQFKSIARTVGTHRTE